MPRIFYSAILILSLLLNVYFIYIISVNPLQQLKVDNGLISQTANITKRSSEQPTKPLTAHEDIAPAANEQHKTNKMSLAIRQLLVIEDFQEASILLHELSQIDQQASEKIEDFWYESAEKFRKNKEWRKAELATQSFLSYTFDDIRFLYLEVQLLVETKQLFNAIKKAYDMQYYVFEPFEQEQSIALARKLTQDEAEQLISIKAWDKVAELALFAQYLDPQHYYLQWLYSQAQFYLGHYHNTLTALTPLLNINNYRVAANELYQKAERALLSPAQIPLAKRGEHYFVNGIINQNVNVQLMLDTGASISLLSPAIYQQLNRRGKVTYLQDIQLNTAGGQIASAIYQVSEFSLQGYKLTNFTFAVSPFMEQESDGLLGMNYLKHFDFYIDQHNQSLVLESK